MSTRKIFNITVTDSVATFLLRQGRIICGNDKYSIRFTFDSEWDGQEQKVARFNFAGKHTDVPFTGNEVDVPVISGATEVEVGVYTEDGPFTTTGAVIPCELSILCKPSASSSDNDKRYLDEARALVEEAREILANIGDGEGLKGVTEALAGKLDKVTATHWGPRLYGVNADGSQVLYGLSWGTSADAIAIRTTGGALNVGTPLGDAHAIPLGFADGRYLVRIPRDKTEGTWAYIEDPNKGTLGQIQVQYGAPINWTLAGRGEGGVVVVGAPTNEMHAVPLGFADGRYVQLITGTGGNRLYGVNPQGKQVEFGAAFTNYPFTLPMRDENYTFTVGEPTDPMHPTTKQFVENGFVPKISPFTNGAWGVYTCTADGSTTLMMATYATNGTIPMRGTGGTIIVGEPQADNHATTKKFVKDAIAAAVNSTNRTVINWMEEIESQGGVNEYDELDRGTYAFGPGRYDVYMSSDTNSALGIATFENNSVTQIIVGGDTDAVRVFVCNDADFYGQQVMDFYTRGNMGEHFLLDIEELTSGTTTQLYIHVKRIELHPVS